MPIVLLVQPGVQHLMQNVLASETRLVTRDSDARLKLNHSESNDRWPRLLFFS